MNTKHTKKMTRRDVLRTARQCSKLFGEPLANYRGASLGELLKSAEKQGACILWVCYSNADLTATI